MLEGVLETPTPEVFREDGLQDVAAATYTTRIGLFGKEAVDMDMFWGKYVKEDRRLLSMLCSEFRQYTVETLLWVPFNSTELFEKEVAYDSYFSSLERFDACKALTQARIHVQREHSFPYLEPVAANRVWCHSYKNGNNTASLLYAILITVALPSPSRS